MAKTKPTIEFLYGKPVNVHILENYLPLSDPYQLKTVLRLQVNRKLEDIKRFADVSSKISSKLWLWILMFIIIAVIGVLVILFLPQIMEMFGGAAETVTGGGV